MVLEITDQNFNEIIASEPEKLTIVDFWAPWCGPCKMMSSVVDALSEEMPNVRFGKVNCDENDGLCSEMEIRNLPTFLFYKNGEQINKLCGGIQKQKFIEEIQKYL